jgi:hypothetical protein
MNKPTHHLPTNDQECDERLIRVLIGYVIEKGMPLNVVSQILMDNLRDKSSYLIRFNQIMSHVQDLSI